MAEAKNRFVFINPSLKAGVIGISFNKGFSPDSGLLMNIKN